ncbi:MAG: hypothetical protein ACRC30_15480 [Clostridium sp.]
MILVKGVDIIVFITIISIFVLIGITFLYLNDKLENLNDKHKLSKTSVKKLNLFKTIIFLISSVSIIFFWLFVVKQVEKLILIAFASLFIVIILIILFKIKYVQYMKKDKKLKHKS